VARICRSHSSLGKTRTDKAGVQFPDSESVVVCFAFGGGRGGRSVLGRGGLRILSFDRFFFFWWGEKYHDSWAINVSLHHGLETDVGALFTRNQDC
jgi:hypothetical protein